MWHRQYRRLPHLADYPRDDGFWFAAAEPVVQFSDVSTGTLDPRLARIDCPPDGDGEDLRTGRNAQAPQGPKTLPAPCAQFGRPRWEKNSGIPSREASRRLVEPLVWDGRL